MDKLTAATDGRLQKMEVDYSSEVDAKIPECQSLAKEGNLDAALDILISLEKKTRTGSDMHSTAKILVSIVRLCYEFKEWNKLNEHLILLSKRRGQLKQAITKMVQEAISYLEETPDMDTKLKLIDTLRTVTSGKIYVEIERARLTRTLALIRERQGDIDGAAKVLHELQVETFGSMEKREKVEFLLEQMRLSLARKDFVRTQIISRKISTKYFEESDTADLKKIYYNLMIELDSHEGSYLSICRHYRALYATPSLMEDKEEMQKTLRCILLYCLLAPYDNEQSDMMHQLKSDKNLEDLSTYKELLNCFLTEELRRWVRVSELYERELRYDTVPDSPSTSVFTPNTTEGDKRWKDLKTRLVEHNIRVIAKYYTRLTLTRLSQLVDLTVEEAEEFLSALVSKKTISAKIDRLQGIVSFRRSPDPTDVLNEWSSNINTLMGLVNKTCHLIAKEEMVHKLDVTA